MRIVIIKLGALGDVVRTLPIAKALRKMHPKAEIVWVTKQNATEIFDGNKDINRVAALPYLEDEEFDLLYNFDIEKEATELAQKIGAKKRYGFYSEEGYAAAFNPGAEYYISTIFDDELKKKNKKTYQEMMFEAAEIPYDRETIDILVSDKEKEFGLKFLKENNLEGKKVVGIHMGASSRWPSKVWHEERVVDFIKKAKSRGWEIVMFGGPNEAEEHVKLAERLRDEEIMVCRNNPNNTIREFISLANICDKFVCSDSFSLHISLGLKKQTVGLFFCTSPDEVEGYGLLKKIVSEKLGYFFPERMNEYSEELVKSISADEVIKELGI